MVGLIISLPLLLLLSTLGILCAGHQFIHSHSYQEINFVCFLGYHTPRRILQDTIVNAQDKTKRTVLLTRTLPKYILKKEKEKKGRNQQVSPAPRPSQPPHSAATDQLTSGCPRQERVRSRGVRRERERGRRTHARRASLVAPGDRREVPSEGISFAIYLSPVLSTLSLSLFLSSSFRNERFVWFSGCDSVLVSGCVGRHGKASQKRKEIG